jgi:quinol monooxygenase YgiN
LDYRCLTQIPEPFLHAEISTPDAGSLLAKVSAVADEVELTVVTMIFEATDAERLLSILSKYVVVSRQQAGCRNIDLCGSVTANGRFLVIEKWESPAAQQAHFNSSEMVDMAQAAAPYLTGPPDIDLFEGISAHDLN